MCEHGLAVECGGNSEYRSEPVGVDECVWLWVRALLCSVGVLVQV